MHTSNVTISMTEMTGKAFGIGMVSSTGGLGQGTKIPNIRSYDLTSAFIYMN